MLKELCFRKGTTEENLCEQRKHSIQEVMYQRNVRWMAVRITKKAHAGFLFVRRHDFWKTGIQKPAGSDSAGQRRERTVQCGRAAQQSLQHIERTHCELTQMVVYDNIRVAFILQSS